MVGQYTGRFPGPYVRETENKYVNIGAPDFSVGEGVSISLRAQSFRDGARNLSYHEISLLKIK